MEKRDDDDINLSHPLERKLIKYVFSGLLGVVMSGVAAGPVMYARFVTMEQSITTLTHVVDKLSDQVYDLKMEVVQLQTANNLLNYEVKERLGGPEKH